MSVRFGRLGSMGLGRVLTPGGPPAPPQLTGGVNPNIYADFVNNSYLGGGASQSTFAAWLTAVGGTYSRASSATYIDGGVVKTAASGVARIFGQGIRLTGAATNQITQSNNLLDATWGTYTPAPVQNVTGPDGIANSGWTHSSSAAPDSTNGLSHAVAGNTTGSPQTVSAFFKQGTSPLFYFGMYDISVGWIVLYQFTWSSGVPVGGLGGGSGSYTTTALANGWWLISITGTAAAAGHGMSINFYPELTSTGNTGKSTLCYGFHVTNTAFLCDYIPTTTATVAQAADSLSFPYTQTTFSALVNTIDQANSPNARLIGSDLPDTAVYINNFATAQSGTFNGTSVISSAASASSYASLHKAMSAGSPASRNIVLDGGAVTSAATAFVSASPVHIDVGQQGGGSNYAYGNFQQLALWNGVVASATDMQRLTT